MQKNQNARLTVCRAVVAMVMVSLSMSSLADVLDSSIQGEVKINKDSATTQVKVNNLADQSADLTDEYREELRQIASLQTYNAQLEKVITNQNLEKESIKKQLAGLDATDRGVIPLMMKMIDMLERIVANDIPFRLEDRENRVFSLQDLVGRADVSVSEKYRRVMTAYQTEMEYGRTTEHYRAPLPGSDRVVDFLRFGRTLLLYQTLDGEESGRYNLAQRKFEVLPKEYNRSVADGLKIAMNQAAPNLIRLPVDAPVKVK